MLPGGSGTFSRNPQRLPLDTLWFHSRTLEQLASALRQMDQSASWSRLVPLKPDGDRTLLTQPVVDILAVQLEECIDRMS